MFLNLPPGEVTSSWSGDARQPAARPLELCDARKRPRLGPEPVQGLDAGSLHDFVAEPLSEPVLAQLQLEAEQPGDQHLEEAAILASTLEAGAQLRVGGSEPGADGVHHV